MTLDDARVSIPIGHMNAPGAVASSIHDRNSTHLEPDPGGRNRDAAGRRSVSSGDRPLFLIISPFVLEDQTRGETDLAGFESEAEFHSPRDEFFLDLPGHSRLLGPSIPGGVRVGIDRKSAEGGCGATESQAVPDPVIRMAKAIKQ